MARYGIRPEALAVGVVLCLGACGGSGGGPTAPGGLSVEAVESRSFTLLNEARSEEGQPRLAFSAAASAVAREHSESMRDRGFFGHVDPERGNLSARLTTTTLVFTVAAENVAAVEHASDPAGFAHANLMASSGHRHNILDARFGRVGVGVARRGDQFWVTQIFLGP